MVVKSAGQVFQEVYALELGSLLNTLFDGDKHVYFPKVVVVARESDAYFHIITSLNILEPKRTGGLGIDANKINRLSLQNHIELMEFVEGTTFRYLTLEEAHMVFEIPTTFHKLGSLLAFDILINNYDRVPLPLWSNEGNPKNLLILVKGEASPSSPTSIHQLTAIDQCVTGITNESLLQVYQNKVKDFVITSYQNSTYHLESVRKWIQTNTGYSLLAQHLTSLNNALKKSFFSLAQVGLSDDAFESSVRRLLHTVETNTKQAMGEMDKDLSGIFSVNMFMNREFIFLTWKTIREVVIQQQNLLS
eukprot:TRINITY_DN8672_c0_g1_i6.p1 TRINITY_DN8672_c0_g1~~TRINITY_DN8672_c0_g1_i6.p1  ORF type:complete len:305 (-),score=67.67 TRINITY_DN8672_c0_g1_i6:35-949(-)